MPVKLSQIKQAHVMTLLILRTITLIEYNIAPFYIIGFELYDGGAYSCISPRDREKFIVT